MSRKHFNQLAHALKAQRPQDSWSAAEADCFRSQWNQDVLAIAAVCAASNPLFKPQRFLGACGGLYNFSTRQSDTELAA